jgi:hypothetical protein
LRALGCREDGGLHQCREIVDEIVRTSTAELTLKRSDCRVLRTSGRVSRQAAAPVLHPLQHAVLLGGRHRQCVTRKSVLCGREAQRGGELADGVGDLFLVTHAGGAVAVSALYPRLSAVAAATES